MINVGIKLALVRVYISIKENHTDNPFPFIHVAH